VGGGGGGGGEDIQSPVNVTNRKYRKGERKC